jgi:aryl-alcohol dehydrogenase-like predicted oxidoreductase
MPPQHVPLGPLGPVCRLGLATRGGTHLAEADVLYALDRGVNFWNWPGEPDALSRAVARLGARRPEVVVCVQFSAATAAEADQELAGILRELNTDYIDILTFYYVERREDWGQIAGPGGSLGYCATAREQGRVRLLGLTSHRRQLAAEVARAGLLDLLIVRYNAAHRGAEKEVFPVTAALGLPVIAYTCLRWGHLLRPTPGDPPGWQVPPAPAWYRFVLQNPSVSVALMAPDDRAQLEEDLTVLEPWRDLTPEEFRDLGRHGDRVRQHFRHFP